DHRSAIGPLSSLPLRTHLRAAASHGCRFAGIWLRSKANFRTDLWSRKGPARPCDGWWLTDYVSKSTGFSSNRISRSAWEFPLRSWVFKAVEPPGTTTTSTFKSSLEHSRRHGLGDCRCSAHNTSGASITPHSHRDIVDQTRAADPRRHQEP